MAASFNTRTALADIDPMFLERWSPRAFSGDPLTPAQVSALFEAARWAPSSSNEQPWLFLYAAQPDHLKTYLEILVPANQAWASRAPLLTVLFARRHAMRGGQPNRLYAFDCGAAWMSLALQAHKMGLITHGMAGFDAQKAHGLLGVPEDKFEAMAVIAVGKPGDAAALPLALLEREKPNARKAPEEVAIAGYYPAAGAGAAPA